MRLLLVGIYLVGFVFKISGQDIKDQPTRTNSDTCIDGVIITLSHLRTIYTIEHTKDSTGIAYAFYPNASIREMRYYKNLVIQKSIGWHQNGFKAYEYYYIKGKLEGDIKRYYESGEIYCKEKYKNGLLEGKQVYYDRNGKIKEVSIYKMGRKA